MVLDFGVNPPKRLLITNNWGGAKYSSRIIGVELSEKRAEDFDGDVTIPKMDLCFDTG